MGYRNPGHLPLRDQHLCNFLVYYSKWDWAMANFDTTTGLTSKWDWILPAAQCIIHGYTTSHVVNKTRYPSRQADTCRHRQTHTKQIIKRGSPFLKSANRHICLCISFGMMCIPMKYLLINLKNHVLVKRWCVVYDKKVPKCSTSFAKFEASAKSSKLFSIGNLWLLRILYTHTI